jgi:hypothetical protein
MTWKEFQICIIGTERKELNEWRKVRSLAHMMYASNGGDKSVYEFWPLPGDPKDERVPLTPEELAKVFSIYN